MFLGWYLGETEFDFENTRVKEDITLVARWERNTVTITLDPCNGEDPTTVTVAIGGSFEELPEAPTYDRWHKFIGWFMDFRTGLQTGTGTQITTETVFNEDTTIYANWYMPGDVTGDGKINNKDANRLLNYIAGEDVEIN